MKNPLSGSLFQVLFARLFIFEVNSVPDLLCACLILFLSNVFLLCLVQDGAFPNLVIQNPGH